MNVDVSSEIVIRRPRTEVATYSANPDNAPAWLVNIKTVEWKTPPPVYSRITDCLRRSFPRAAAGLHLRGCGTGSR